MWDNDATHEEVLSRWRRLRTDISSLPAEDQVLAVITFIAPLPYGVRTVDLYAPAEWPTPWEILANRKFCTSSISLLAYHTLAMVSDAELTLDLIDDGGTLYLVVVADGAVINYYPGSVISKIELEKKVSIVRSYSRADVTPIR